MNERKNVVTFASNPVTLIGDETKVGEKAPEFTLVKQDLSEFKLSETSGKIRLISIVPSLDTSVCSLQTRKFNEDASKIKDLQIITISMDLPFAQGRFCGANDIENILVASDYKDRAFGEKYGFIMKENMLLARGIVIIDKNDKIRYVEYVPEVTNEVNFEKALEVAKELENE
ncbi:thiol peroxidase [Criibacterium bergeronii]|uniref:Thiol peroxidase n=1 Tax=Criibacterium bergeronii TaxID=1871336 RepID=A0A371IK69_9FIRM|nr:thiol peroxidase [Criibacterium bergeronii]RDY20866.1 thiol peroxidase [Criibacterium bergeronii]